MFVRLFAAGIALVAGAQAGAVEVRLCERQVRTAPLNDERGVQSALIQGFAVVNTGKEPVKLNGIGLRLKQDGQIRDERWLPPAEIARAVKLAPQIEALAQIFPPQFCNGEMLAGAKLAKADTLAPGEAIVFPGQPFAWRGARDRLEIIARTGPDAAGREDLAAVPVVSEPSKTKLLFPVAGRTYVAVAASFHTPHRWGSIEEFAVDIVMLTDGGSTHRGDGTRLADYAVFGAPVRAAAAGKVVAASDSMPDNAAMLKRVGETDEAYLTRLLQGQSSLLASGMAKVLGNHVVIDHGNGEFTMYAHLKQGSVRALPGAAVRAGEAIGTVGSSGNSTEPHLHFQICDTPDIAACRPIPPQFIGYSLPLELGPRTIQSGDIVQTLD